MRSLEGLRNDLVVAGSSELAALVEELISIELDALRATAAADQPFAGRSRFLLAP